MKIKEYCRWRNPKGMWLPLWVIVVSIVAVIGILAIEIDFLTKVLLMIGYSGLAIFWTLGIIQRKLHPVTGIFAIMVIIGWFIKNGIFLFLILPIVVVIAYLIFYIWNKLCEEKNTSRMNYTPFLCFYNIE